MTADTYGRCPLFFGKEFSIQVLKKRATVSGVRQERPATDIDVGAGMAGQKNRSAQGFPCTTAVMIDNVPSISLPLLSLPFLPFKGQGPPYRKRLLVR